MKQGGTEAQRLNGLTGEVIGACIEVHRCLGPGLLESAYERCLVHELSIRQLKVDRQIEIPLSYKGLSLDCGYRVDVLVEGLLVLEIKAVEKLLPVHEAQVITYLKLTRYPVGLLVNFHVPVLRQGVRRFRNTPLGASVPLCLPVVPSDSELQDCCE